MGERIRGRKGVALRRARLEALRDAALSPITLSRSPKVARMSTRTSAACAKSTTIKSPGKSLDIEKGQSSERTAGQYPRGVVANRLVDEAETDVDHNFSHPQFRLQG